MKNWVRKAQSGESISIEDNIQEELLKGFRKHYPKENTKRIKVDEAIGIGWQLNITKRSGGFFLVGKDGELTSVSTYCQKNNDLRDIKEACRGSIHIPQILKKRKHSPDVTQMDHYNDGGFKAICEAWIKMQSLTTKELARFVVKLPRYDKQSVNKGFVTWKEPYLTSWSEYHKKHALLQEITTEKHKELTKQRKKRRT